MIPTFLRRFRGLAFAPLAAGALLAAPARAQPVPASNIFATPIGVSSITISWNGDPGTTYQVVTTTGGVLSSTTSALTDYTEPIVGYSTNTLATFEIQATSGAYAAQTSAPISLYTAAAQPSGSAVLQTNGTSTTLSWQTNGNPSTIGTSVGYYNIEWYVTGSTPIVVSTQPAVILGTATATVDGLPGGQTVYLEVQALNGNGVPSLFDVLLSTSIPAIGGQTAISSATFAAGISSITWYWSASTGAINYQLFEDSGVAASPLLGPSQLSYTQTGLTPNTLYQDYIQSYGLTSSTQSAPYAWYTLAAPTAGLTLLSLSTGTATATLSWGPNGNPPNTTYDVEWWTRLTSTITVSTGATTAVLSNLSGGSTLYFTVQAVNANGIKSGYDATLYTTVPSTSFPVGILNVPAGAQGSLTFVLPTAVVGVHFSSNAFNGAVNLTVQQETSVPGNPATPSDLAPISGNGGAPILFQMAAVDANGVPRNINPILPLIVSVTFNSSEIGGVDPGSLSLCYDDPVHGWTTLAAARSGSTMTTAVPSLGFTGLGYFQIFGVEAPGGGDQITVGPNPLRTSVNAGQLMTFRNLPIGTRVRIFTYVGAKLADIAADDSGIAAWDGSNAAGKPVASGVYIAVIQGPGFKKLMRVAVER
jgi:hypothetical protein